jgi:hypothetical protein
MPTKQQQQQHAATNHWPWWHNDERTKVVDNARHDDDVTDTREKRTTVALSAITQYRTQRHAMAGLGNLNIET